MPNTTPLYVATKQVARVPSGYQIFCVDGTPPGWKPGQNDFHWDHHQPGGAEVQIDELPALGQISLIQQFGNFGNEDGPPPCILTTLVDADAIVAAAWLQLTNKEEIQQWALYPDGVQVRRVSSRYPERYGFDSSIGAMMDAITEKLPPNATIWETKDLLRAIAHECDHLSASRDLLALRTFAANAVAAIKVEKKRIRANIGQIAGTEAFSVGDRVLFGEEDTPAQVIAKDSATLQVQLPDGLTLTLDPAASSVRYPKDYKDLSAAQAAFAENLSFKLCTEWLLRAIRGEEPFPGTTPGSVESFFETLQADVAEALEVQAVKFLPAGEGDSQRLYAVIDSRLIPRTIDCRVLYRTSETIFPEICDGKFPQRLSPVTLSVQRNRSGGTTYTLGSFSSHPEWPELDLHRSGVYQALSEVERQEAELSGENSVPEGWNGRRSVGGSGFNESSRLAVEQVLAIIHSCLVEQPSLVSQI